MGLSAAMDRRLDTHSGGECTPTLTGDTVPGSALRLVNVGISRIARAFRLHLRPRDASVASFDQWLADLGEVVDDVDWRHELYLSTCEINGWAVPPLAMAPAPALASDDADPSGLDQDEMALDDAPTVATLSRVSMPTRQQLEAQEAAERFVAWVRECGRCGTYLDRDFSDLCAEFFEAEELEPIADNVLRPVLLELTDDVLKSRTDRGTGKGKRKRHYRWTILEPETVETVAPWDELPMLNRRAA